MSHPSISQKRAAFRALHQSGCFVLPNPWDAGSASALASLGFKALATTSSGYAWSCARADGQLSRDGVLGIFRPKTTKCSGGPAVCGLQRGITFFEIPIWALFE